MGLFFRKSVKCGPFRFTLSKSGVGVSVGVRGFRVGSGPHGNHVSMGRGGIYYRKTFSNHSPQLRALQPSVQPESVLPVSDGLEEIGSGNVSAMQDSSAAALIAEINSKAKTVELFRPVMWLFVGLWIVSFMSGGLYASCIFIAIGLPACYFANQKDQLTKSVVLFYDLQDEKEAEYKRVYEAFESLGACSRAWHIEASGDVNDRKRSSGASTLVRRKNAVVRCLQPQWLQVNFDVPCLPAGNKSILFLPDTILILQESSVGAVSYDDLEVLVGEMKFVESQSIPADAKIVDRTWRYVNKSGGPDRRFKENTEIPIVAYGEIQLKSKSGLNECFQFSNPSRVYAFAEALASYGNEEKPHEKPERKQPRKKKNS